MHDQNFKNLILDYPVQALEFFAGEEAGSDLSEARIVPVRQEQLKERLGDRFRELDTPLLMEWSDGRREAILFVVEEETKTSEFSIYRLARYCLDMAELMGTDRVVPVVIFLRTGNHRTYLRLGSDSCAYMEFRYLMCNLKSLSSAGYYDSDNIVARLNLPNMAYPPEDRLEMYLAAQTGLAQLETSPEKQRKYADFIDFYADLSEDEVMRYRERYLSEKGDIMGLASVLREEGREEGMQQGTMKLLSRQIARRFQVSSDSVHPIFAGLTTEQLEELGEMFLEAESLDEIRGWAEEKLLAKGEKR
jgi:hypothetical protein